MKAREYKGTAINTYPYKHADGLEIKADVGYDPNRGRGMRPVVVYMHGGSLIGGSRDQLFTRESPLRDMFLEAGFALVSIDYRLCPETKLPELWSDVEAAFRWVREKGPELFEADPSRVVAWGESAGGYLTFLAGYRVKPRPQVLVVESGYADIIGPWQMKPSRDPKHCRPRSDFVSEEAAWREVSGPPIVNSEERKGDGGAFNGYVRQRGEWPKAVTGWDPVAEAEKYAPYLPNRNVTAEYPPTFIIHGRKDQDIPFPVAADMDAELTRRGVEHRLTGIENGGHGYTGGDPADVLRAHESALEFVKQHLRMA